MTNFHFHKKRELKANIDIIALNMVLLIVPKAPPYSGSQLTNGGPLTKIVVEVLCLAKINVEIRYAPWARIMHYARNGNCLMLGLWSIK